MVTVLCVWMSGRDFDKYPYVSRLQSMVARNLSHEYEFVCLTDKPNEIDCKAIPLEYCYPGKWCKMEMWRPDLPVNGDKILYLDLDEVIVDSIDPLVEINSDFVMTQCSYTYNGNNPKRVARYSSAVVLYKPGVRPELWHQFTVNAMDQYMSDQDLVGGICPMEDTFPEKWIYKVRKERHMQLPEPGAKIMSFADPEKPHESDVEWLKQYWR